MKTYIQVADIMDKMKWQKVLCKKGHILAANITDICMGGEVGRILLYCDSGKLVYLFHIESVGGLSAIVILYYDVVMTFYFQYVVYNLFTHSGVKMDNGNSYPEDWSSAVL